LTRLSEQQTPVATLLQAGSQRRLLWSYGLGDAGTGMAATQMGFYLFVFFTSVVGLPAWMAGCVLMVLKVWDGINDPLVGFLSDHTRHPWGPRIPWILFGGVPLGICIMATWWVPPGGIWMKFSLLVLIASITQVAYTCVNLPYSALSAELTPDIDLRTRLNAARFTGSIIAGLSGIVLAAGLGLKVSECGGTAVRAEAFMHMGLVTGLAIIIGSLLCGWGLKPFAAHCQQPSGHPEPLKQQLLRIARNGRFLRVLGLYLLLWCALQLMQTVALLFLTVVMHVPGGWSTWILVPFQLSALVGLQLWSWVSSRWGRIPALRWGGLLWIAACMMAMLLIPLNGDLGPFASLGNSVSFVFLVITILTVGLGASTAFLIPWSLLPDAIDADPDKPAGLYTAWMVVIQKFGIGLSVFMLGNGLSLSGYRACTAPELLPSSALTTIRLCMGLIPAVMVVLGLLVVRRWPRRPHNHALSLQP
jgi:GPH family glycoside/pentoside/hexuronide:cation symporter